MPCNCSSPILPNQSGISPAEAAVESLCREAMSDCQSRCFTDTRNCMGGCNGTPIAMTQPQTGSEAALERCCDANGCCGLYLKCCRNPYWPSFAHPTWLCCNQLYRQ